MKNFCDSCGTDALDAGTALCGACADDLYDRWRELGGEG